MGVMTRSSLWMANDHLLLIKNHRWGEDYSRYYFSDIEALIIHPTREFLWTSAIGILALVSTLALGLVTILGSEIDTLKLTARWTMGIFSFPLFLFLVINLIRGRTCRVTVHTGGMAHLLPCPRRRRGALGMLKVIRPLIEKAQDGRLLSQDLKDIPSSEEAPPLSALSGPRHAGALRYEHGQWHLALFCFLLVDCLDTGIRFFHTSIRAGLLFFLIAQVPALVCLVMALMRQSGSSLPKTLQGVTWTTVGYYALFTLASSFRGNNLVPGATDLADLFKSLIGKLIVSPRDSSFLYVSFILSFLIALGLSLTGMTLLYRYRKTADKPPPLPSSSE